MFLEPLVSLSVCLWPTSLKKVLNRFGLNVMEGSWVVQ